GQRVVVLLGGVDQNHVFHGKAPSCWRSLRRLSAKTSSPDPGTGHPPTAGTDPQAVGAGATAYRNATSRRRMRFGRRCADHAGWLLDAGMGCWLSAHRPDLALGTHLPGGYRMGDLHPAEPARDALGSSLADHSFPDHLGQPDGGLRFSALAPRIDPSHRRDGDARD